MGWFQDDYTKKFLCLNGNNVKQINYSVQALHGKIC